MLTTRAKGFQRDRPRQVQPFGGLATPIADQFLAVIVGLRVVGFCFGGRADLVDAEHVICGVAVERGCQRTQNYTHQSQPSKRAKMAIECGSEGTDVFP